MSKLQITISLRDEEINKFQIMIDNYEERILNIRNEYEFKLVEKETIISNYLKEINEFRTVINTNTNNTNSVKFFY
jgi:hypothetical protein